VICNGFSTGEQFRDDLEPTRENDGPYSLTDEDWMPHSAGWMTGLSRLHSQFSVIASLCASDGKIYSARCDFSTRIITNRVEAIDSPRSKLRGIIDPIIILIVLANPEVELRGIRERDSTDIGNFPDKRNEWLS